ncbi:hypothetical protein FISHEDRAFT_59549 [Fistulina hepatica ATCC 64428]|uniref:Uncharacterized protein n=1 Tax=Fistulina hepatica ATCC 64428 TaxID=1128425 RepID=A0A0D7A9S3_9AGAR|nr:hypothetical protein FISHEDRAFT_59549 [Fistulina hepatica ATCC 64428]
MEVDKATEQAPETNGSDEHKRNGLTSPVAVDAANEEPADIAKTDVEAPELSAANADVTATVDEMDTTAENGIVAVTKPAIEETPAAADESMLTVGDVSMTETDAPAEFDPGAVGTE